MPYQGPFVILKVNDSGAVCMKVKNVENTYNICCLTAYIGAEDIGHGGECSMQTSRKRRRQQN